MSQIQVNVNNNNRRKYKSAEFDDNMVEYLIKYLGLESYEQLQDFLKNCHIPLFD